MSLNDLERVSSGSGKLTEDERNAIRRSRLTDRVFFVFAAAAMVVFLVLLISRF